MVVNIVLLAGFTFGCNSVRHLVGGRLDCFSCPHNIAQVRTGYKLWRCVTWFNNHHMEWAWVSLLSVGYARNNDHALAQNVLGVPDHAPLPRGWVGRRYVGSDQDAT